MPTPPQPQIRPDLPPPTHYQLPTPGVPSNVVYIPAALCPNCKLPLVWPNYRDGHTGCQIGVASTLLVLGGIIPGIIYMCVWKTSPIARCPHCDGRL